MRRALALAALGTMVLSAQTFREAVAAAERPAWIAYTVPIIAGQHQMCNWNEKRKLMLEGARELTVLFRVEKRAVQKIRVATEECEIDAGELPLVRLKVTPAESIAILSEYVTNDSALHAISMHSDPTAAPVLVKIAREGTDAKSRSKALFWLASSAQRTIAKDELARAIEQDPATEVKKSAVHGLSRLPAGEGIPKLIELAQTNKNPEVRKQAMFWLGQSKDSKAIDFFEKLLTK